MTQHICDYLIDYYNETLTEEEKVQFESHLQTCESCREELEELYILTEDLPYLSEPVPPPSGMKERILTNVFAEEETSVKEEAPKALSTENKTAPLPIKKRKHPFTWVLAASLFLSLLGNLYAASELFNKEESVSNFSVIKMTGLEPGESITGTGVAAFIEKEDAFNVTVEVNNMTATTGEEVYQVWLLKDGEPIPAGAFTVNTEGAGTVSYNIPKTNQEWDTIAVTLEPTSGNETPQGNIVLSAGL